MKIYIVIIILFFTKSVVGQNYSGVFLTWHDYKNNKLTYEINCDSSKEKIKLNDFFSQQNMEVIQNGNKIKLNKDSIFGYRDCKNKEYRFYKSHDKEYLIIENKTIIVYQSYVSVPVSSGKTNQLVAEYYFSRDLTSDILPLTITNLKKTFPDNIKLHNQLDMEFNSTKEVSKFDSVHKMYKINYLLSQLTTN